jgi:carboxypeptidase PM20D1
MFKKTLLALLILTAGLISIVVVNTIRAGNEIPVKESMTAPPVNDSALKHFTEAIQIKTISWADTLPIDTAEFIRFRHFMERAYPLVHQKMERRIFNEFSYLYELKGSDTSLQPYVLMAHMDVVPVEPGTESRWSHDPFNGEVIDNVIWGRGVADDKGSVIAIMEAAEELLRQNFQPRRTIYLSFGHDEEISGHKGAALISKWFLDQKIRPELVIDEGGEITLEQFPSLKRPVAAIAVGEKGYLSFELSVNVPGGHSSMPEKETSIDILNRALVKVREKQMPFRISPPMAELFERLAPGLPFTERMAMSNQWLFGGMLQKKFESDHVTNSLFHTTIVPTMLKAGVKDNVIPSSATAIVNSRNMIFDPEESVIAFMKKQINDDRVKITPFKANTNPSPMTPANGPAFKKVEEIIYKVMPDVIPVPYVLMGGTDSKHFTKVSDGVIRFNPSIDAKGYHGIDERLPVSDFSRMIFFFQLLIRDQSVSDTKN